MIPLQLAEDFDWQEPNDIVAQWMSVQTFSQLVDWINSQPCEDEIWPYIFCWHPGLLEPLSQVIFLRMTDLEKKEHFDEFGEYPTVDPEFDPNELAGKYL